MWQKIKHNKFDLHFFKDAQSLKTINFFQNHALNHH
jgi:hypothetical protein